MDSRLKDFFTDPDLTRPDGPNSVHFFRALFHLCGESVPMDAYSKQIAEKIGDHNHYLFVLVDGMGRNLAPQLPTDGWFSTAEQIELSSVYPSTTAVALTSQATALWPAEHGITGWNTHLPDRGVTVLPLKATERLSGKPVKQLDIPFRDIVRPDSRFPRISHSPRVFMKKSLRGGMYAKWGFQGITRTGTKTVSQGFSRVLHHLRKINEPSFTHFYIEDIDSLSHRKGPFSDNVTGLLARIDRELSKLSEELGDKVRIVVSADHGHIDVPREHHHILNYDDPILDFLEAPPSGESRNPIYHVKQGRTDDFVNTFQARYGGDFLLVEPDDLQAEMLLGPEALSDLTRQRLGSFVGLAKGPGAIEFIAKHGKSKNHRGMHGGLSKHEIQVPLFLL